MAECFLSPNKAMKLANKKTAHIRLVSLIPLFFFILDRVFKHLSLKGVLPFEKNYGLATSISLPAGLKLFFYLLVILLLTTLFFFLFKSFQKRNLLLILASSLIILGGFSNLIDRLTNGFVIDYLNFYFFNNNLADLMIWTGFLSGLFCFLKSKRGGDKHAASLHRT